VVVRVKRAPSGSYGSSSSTAQRFAEGWLGDWQGRRLMAMQQRGLESIAIGPEVFGKTNQPPPSQVGLATSDSAAMTLGQGTLSPIPSQS
jgi:hypothetical protein